MKEHVNNTRKKILDSAIRVLNRKEFNDCLIGEIAKSAGVGKGTIYLYFKSKEELYYSILFKLMNEVMSIVDDAKKSGLNPSEQVSLLIKSMGEFFAAHKHVLMALKEETAHKKSKLHNQLHEQYNEVVRAISNIFEKGIARKVFKKYSPVLLSTLLFYMISVGARSKIMDLNLIEDILMRGIIK